MKGKNRDGDIKGNERRDEYSENNDALENFVRSFRAGKADKTQAAAKNK